MESVRITDEQQHKALVTLYVPLNDYQLWTGLPEFTTTVSYKQFKVAIL